MAKKSNNKKTPAKSEPVVEEAAKVEGTTESVETVEKSTDQSVFQAEEDLNTENGDNAEWFDGPAKSEPVVEPMKPIIVGAGNEATVKHYQQAESVIIGTHQAVKVSAKTAGIIAKFN